MLEYVTIALGIVAGVSAAVAFIYRKGRTDGSNHAAEKSIKADIKKLCDKVEDNAKANDKVHGQLFLKVGDIGSKIDKLQGSNEIIKDLITQLVSK